MVVVIFRAGPAAKCLIKSLPTLLKSGVSRARIDFLPPGSKGSDGSDCPLGGRNGRWFFFFLPSSLILEFAKGRLQTPNNSSTPGSKALFGEKGNPSCHFVR